MLHKPTDATARWRQVITSAEFHPIECHTFAFASSKGCIRLADLRASALADRAVRTYEEVRRVFMGRVRAAGRAACTAIGSASYHNVSSALCAALGAGWQAAMEEQGVGSTGSSLSLGLPIAPCVAGMFVWTHRSCQRCTARSAVQHRPRLT